MRTKAVRTKHRENKNQEGCSQGELQAHGPGQNGGHDTGEVGGGHVLLNLCANLGSVGV